MKVDIFESLDIKKYILVKGARVHNLKNIDLSIPKNNLIVITGLSGSGKSSLAFDTIFAEGQRRYVESLSSYARQFLGRMNKPEVDYIKGISPAIAIEQKVNNRNPRSTVGITSEIYEYLKLLFARIGKTYSPITGILVKKHSVTDVVNFITTLGKDSKVLITSPLLGREGKTLKDKFEILLQQGFSRIMSRDTIINIVDNTENLKISQNDLRIVIDRLVINNDDGLNERLSDSVQTAFYEGDGSCYVEYYIEEKLLKAEFSNKFEADGIRFEEPTANMFSFNNPYGACKRCEGFGNIIGIDEDLVVPDKSKSVYEGAIVCWKGEKMSEWNEQLLKNAYKFDFPIHRAYYDLTQKEKDLLWSGNEYFQGINRFFSFIEEQSFKIQYRVMLSRYRGKTKCPDCKGIRIRKDANYVKISDKSISDLVIMSIEDLYMFFQQIHLSENDTIIASRILLEVNTRLKFMLDVGLGYLTLERSSSTLSGGESQRINLATSLGSNLVGSMYILDEPSIGLHPRDTMRLINVLKNLRDLGNTVIVVEHDSEIIKAADYIIDMGYGAGVHGGSIIFNGAYKELIKKTGSLTAEYLTKVKQIPLPKERKTWKEYIEIKGAAENNLKSVNVKFPLNCISVITGVSGSGKTTLVKKILYTGLKQMIDGSGEKAGQHKTIEGDIKKIGSVEFVDQNPIGRSSRSNPATYLKAYDDIRQLYSEQQLSKIRGYKPGYFSFNIIGGRCEECEGEGFVKISMQFMADVSLVCESCSGKRFKEEVLDVTYKNKTITDILEMTIEQSIEFFSDSQHDNTIEKRITAKLKTLQDVGLGYLRLGQSSSTFSGGEAQRVKLAFFLSKAATDKTTLFIFDEPTTGLHFHDINNLYNSFRALIEKGHTIIIIEHNMDIIKCADWIIDLGPEGGEKGGYVIYEGIPEGIVKIKESYTGRFLHEYI